MSTPAHKMVAEQLVPHGVTDQRVLRAMSEIPREEFISPRLRRHAYDDRALGIECGQTISQPLVVALMTQAVASKPDDVALEVGAGSGYQAAVLSRLCRKLITLEREPALAEHASATLRRLGFDNIEVAVADGSLGWPAEAPYDIILVAAAAREVPPALIEQLAEGGRMVIPVDVAPDEPQDLRLYLKQGGEVTYRSMFPVLFVPLRTG
ncbi:MAG TPA: protein-L-isoaspartate(D-aspartate) O-methyltransferase [Candidatus Dormibacteraeota bacterium]|jgi:protein-L-isoaspartate(D-aspartate) O-methyltransferase|nr:protein-L-isoaspartate(D-aspartate) O-methyltransferase [Candidatus Dormibacteraeota bacterium]